MWQEARKQEKKLRCIMIDYKKRAERRQAYYARMRMDPHQLMRIYGQKCKFHIVGENAKVNNTDGQLMPWQGDPDVMIDRFDVRAHLDFITESKITDVEIETTQEEEKFQRKCSYERYRTLVQIDATGASEEQYLKQLEVEEGIGRTEMENKRRMENDKIMSKANAKFHYKYDDSSDILDKGDVSSDDDNDSTLSQSDGELSDIDINVNVLDLSEEQTNHLDALATQYGIGYGQYCKQLLLEKKEFEYVKKLEEEEEERAKMPGRKGKSARRCLRAKQKTLRGSPLSFALLEGSPLDDEERIKREGSSSSDSSRSKTPVDSKVEFITEFGGEEDNSKNGSGIIPPSSDPRVKSKERSNTHHKRSRHRSSSRHRSHGKNSSSQDHKSRDRHKSRSRSREHKSRNSRSKSRDRHSKNSHSRHSSRTKNEPHSERSHSTHTALHGSRSRSPKNTSSHRSRSRSPKNNENNYRNTSRGLNQKSRDRSQRRSRSRSTSRSHTFNKESSRKKSRSRSRSKSTDRRSKSPHETIVKRLGTNIIPAPVIDKSNLTPREKMKLRMQKLLNRQIKCDKKEEHKKQVAKEQEIEERDMEIYEMSRMMRMRERERKVYRSPSPKGRMPSYDASRFHYIKSRSNSPE